MRTSYTDGVALRALLTPGLSQGSKSFLSIPLASLCSGNECALVLSIDHARVSSDIGPFQQSLSPTVGGDRFQVSEGIAHEIDRGGFYHQRGGSFFGEDHGDCVEQDRRHSR